MADKGNRDYYAFQELWQTCARNYIQAEDSERRCEITNTFRESLVDIEPKGKKALKTTFEDWEKNEWVVMCTEKLDDWKRNNFFKTANPRIVENEISQIRKEQNFLRYEKILQIIQNSGIGLGSGRDRRNFVDRKGFKDG